MICPFLWKTGELSLREVTSDPASLKVCYCDLAKPELTIVLSSDEESTADNTWLSTLLYTLSMDKEEVLLPDSWLSDTITRAAQLLIFQEFPQIGSLQDPPAHQCLFPSSEGGEFGADHPCWRLSLVYYFQGRMERSMCMTACTLLFPVLCYVQSCQEACSQDDGCWVAVKQL